MTEELRFLGKNETAYSAAMSEQVAEQEFLWATVKRERVAGLLNSLGSIGRGVDIGCRNGVEAAFYRDAAQIKEMHGVDISEVPLSKAREKGILTHRWISGDAPFPADDGFFDVVIALDVIEHIFDTDEFLSELTRVTAKGGHLLIATPNLVWWWSRLRLMFGRAPSGIGAVSTRHAKDRCVDTKHLRVNVASEWIHLFEQHGLMLTLAKGYNYPKLLRFPFNRVDNVLTDIRYMAHSYIFVLKKN